jgi:hypothetical protein
MLPERHSTERLPRSSEHESDLGRWVSHGAHTCCSGFPFGSEFAEEVVRGVRSQRPPGEVSESLSFRPRSDDADEVLSREKPEFQFGRAELLGRSRQSLTIAGGRGYVRDDREVLCIGLE